MTAAQAEALTRHYQSQVLKVADLLSRRMRVTALRVDVSDVDGWWDRVSPAIQKEILTGQSALARLARGYLQQHALLNGVSLSPVVIEPSPQQVAEALRVTGPVAFKTQMAVSGSETAATRVMASQLQGSAERLVLAGSRDTTMQTFQQRNEMAGWRRTGTGSCAFCAMLISRGAVYSKKSSDFPAHDRCGCSAEPLYRREPEPPHVRKLQEQWLEATAGKSGAAAARAWRAFHEGQGATP